MKASEIELGGIYSAKVTDKPVPVRLDRDHPRGGWEGTNLHTGRKVRIKSARKLRCRIKDVVDDEGTAEIDVDQAKPTDDATESSPDAGEGNSDSLTSGHASDHHAASKKMGCLEAAAEVLRDAGEPLTCPQMMERILERGLWTTAGRTPAATLYSAMIREIKHRGEQARFMASGRGCFQLRE